MRKLITVAIAIAIIVVWQTKFVHTYGWPGSLNGGVVIAGHGYEIWGSPGFFIEEE